MGSSAVIRASITGVILQALMVFIGKMVPAVATMPNFYAICGTMLATVTGALVARSRPSGTASSTWMQGAVAGGASSVVGGVLAVVTGQWPGFAVVQLLFPAISGAVGGGAGGLLGRVFVKKPPTPRS